MEVQKCWCAYSVFMHRLLRKSHTRMVLSSLADTKYLPPGWNARPRTQLSWPLRVSRHRPTLTSQMRMVLSREPEARNGPWWWPFLLSAPAASFIAEAAASGAQAMHSTVCSWSRNSTCRRIKPSLDSSLPAEAAHGNAHLAVFWIRQPNTYCLIIWACGKDAAFDVHSHHSHPLSMACVGFHTVAEDEKSHVGHIIP